MANVLTVDDSPSVCQMVKMVLGPEGHNVVAAHDGAAGLSKARAERFDLILTDLNMPVMNGMEMIRAVRALPNQVGVPIVFLTTESDETAKRDAKAAGATGWLTKPFRPEQLHNVIARLVRK